IQSKSMNSGLPQSYQVRFTAPAGLSAVQLLDYDSKGRPEHFGSYRLGETYGEFQRSRPIDWSGPRAERAERLRDLGFADTARRGGPEVAERRGGEAPAAARWKKLRSGAPVSGADTRHHGASAITIETRKGPPPGQGPGGSTPAGAIQVEPGSMTHVAVTEPGIQRVTYEALRDGGLDLAGMNVKDIAVTWRGQPVDRWISGSSFFGPGGTIEFLGRPPEGDDALYIDANLYQVTVDSSLARDPRTIGQGKAKRLSASYLREAWVDRPLMYHYQSPTGDPWVERSVLVRGGVPSTVTLDLPIAGPVVSGPGHLVVGLGAMTDLPDLRDASGQAIPEHNVEVWARGPGSSFAYVTSSSASGHRDWTIEATVPAGLLAAGVNQVQLRFSTQYFFSLVVVDRYGARYSSPYKGPSLDFAPDRSADGYLIEGLASPAVVAYAEGAGGALTRVDPRVVESGAGYAAELRQMDAARYWVTESPHAPEVFTTEAPADLLAGPAGLVVIAGSSLVGSWALDDYVAQKAAFGPVVVDVEDVYNSVGFGMALPSAITDYLAARDAFYPFSHVQLVGTDCFDRLNYISSCLSHVPLPTAPVNVNVFSPSQNRLVDLDGDGIADKAVGQFSVRDETELATIVGKGATWDASPLSAGGSALFIAEESDGLNDFSGQIDRLSDRLGWSGTDMLHMADHSSVLTARAALSSSLDAGRAVTVFSGHSSPNVWAFRSLLTPGTAAALTNHGRPTIMVPLACETTYDISPSANVLGHQLLFAGDNGALAISGAVALSGLEGNERMANHVLDGLKAGLTLGEAVLAGRRAIGASDRELQDNWITQGDVTVRLQQ
ncbi:MAG TPA: C25 family cysteine peptidase, partial [Thermoanaerobaculia bacterium]|nr:C25 family cysteine peptidase [Thermoanaerobaculia bacterium]